MGIFDFFKKKRFEEQISEEIRFEDIDNWLNKKEEKISERQKEPEKEIKECLIVLLGEFEENITVLKNIDLTEKKAPERAKLIVRENLYKFIAYLEKLVQNLEELESESLEELINKINLSFSEFEKKSLMSFQKSTFLIGEELGNVKVSITKFFKVFNKIIKENQQVIEQGKIILIIKKKLRERNSLEKIELDNIKAIDKIKEETDNFEDKIEKIRKEIELVKQSQEYAEQIKIKNQFEKAKTKLLIELQELKEMIDFKALAKVYHSIEGKMCLIKEYRDDFKQAFEKYNLENLGELIDIKELDVEKIKKKIKEINEIKQNIKDVVIEKDLIEELEKEINYIIRKIQESNLEKSKKEKINKRLKGNKEQIKTNVAEELKKINVIVKV